MEYEGDEAKPFANLRKHGIDFIDVPAVFDGDIVTVEDVDTDVLEWFKSQGRGDQTQINQLLRAYMDAHQ